MSNEPIKQTFVLDSIINLRALVLALGEASDPPWWRTKFMNDVGFRFLERVYPRAFFQAALNASGKAARDTHDRSVGRVGVFHLFRLPPGLEVDLHAQFSALSNDKSASLMESINNVSLLMENLRKLGICEDTNDLITGAVKIGVEADCYKLETFNKAASIYFKAFENGKQAFPYLSKERDQQND